MSFKPIPTLSGDNADFIANVTVSGSILGTGDGSRITNNGVPYLLSGDSPAENDTLQDVTTRGNTTSTSIISTGPYISGVSGLFSDKVGIGTTAPTEKLTVAGNIKINKTDDTIARLSILTDKAFGREFYLENNGTTQEIVAENTLTIRTLNNDNKIILEGGSNTDNIQFVTDEVERMRVTNTGLGIGTTNPASKLNVVGSSTIGWSNLANAYFLAGTSSAGIGIDNNEIASKGGPLFIGTIDTDDDLVLRAGGSADRVTIDGTSGNVGIGATNPTEKLEINGNTYTRSKTRGIATNYATSEGWAVSTAVSSAVGYFGGNFTSNGPSTENKIEYDIGPFGLRELIWKTIPETDSNDDGGWNKYMDGFDNSAVNGFISVVYVKRSSSASSGSFYHGCSYNSTNNLDGSANTNPYFHSPSISTLPENVWCVSIGVIYAANDSNTATSSLGGIYRLDTGVKISGANTFRQKPSNTLQQQRVYHYYSTSPTAKLDFAKPAFYVVDGSEPTLSELTAGASGGDDVYWSANGNDISNDNTGNVGIGTTSPSYKLEIDGGDFLVNTTNSGYVQVDDSDNSLKLSDNVVIKLGTGGDFQMLHNGSSSSINNYLGNLFITQNANDADIIFRSDDGSGGVAEYLRLDGGIMSLVANKDLLMQNDGDGGKIKLGASQDLQIYHDGSNSYIDNGTGNLIIDAGVHLLFRNVAGESLANFYANGAVELYYDNSKKFETRSTGVYITGDLEVNGGDITLWGTGRIQGIDTVSAATDAANKAYVDAQVGASDTLQEVTDNGNTTTNSIGIGTTSPNAKLHVDGSWILDGITGGHFENFTYGTQLDISELTSGGWARENKIVTSDSTGNVFFGVLGDATTTNRAYWVIDDATTGTAYTSTNGIILLKNGNVGMGVTTPESKLHIIDSSSSTQLRLNQSGGNDAVLGSGSNYFQIKTGSGGNSTALVIQHSDQNVGIGITNPSQKLEVIGTIKQKTGSGYTNYVQSSVAEAQLTLSTYSSNQGANPSAIIFSPNLTEAARFDNSGNLGIGTTSPTDGDLTLNAPNLHVKGSSASGAFHLVQRLQAGSDANDSGAALLINHSNDRGLLIEAGRGGAGAEPDDQAVAHFGLINSSGVNSRFMTARQGGNVGIGTASPATKLNIVSTGSDSDALVVQDNARKIKIGRDSIQVTDLSDNNTQLYLNGAGGNVSIPASGLIIGGTSPKAQLHVLSGSAASYTPDSEGDTVVIESSTAGGISLIGTGGGGAQKQKLVFGTTGDTTGAVVIYDPNNSLMSVGTTATSNFLRFTSGNGVEVMRLAANGNVGIGTTAPSVGLQLGNSVSGQTKTAIFNSEGGTEVGLTIKSRTNRAKLVVSDNDTTAYVIAEGGIASFGMADTAAATNISVLSSGNVGIGITSPSANLDVVGSSKFRGTVNHSWFNYSTSEDTYIRGGKSTSKVHINDSHSADVLMAAGGGNVGIGNTSPSYKLDVSGGIKAGGKVTYEQSAGSLTTTGYAVAGLTSNTNGSSAGFTFTCFGHGGYQKIVYSCHNVSNTWNTQKVIDEGTNDFDVTASANGSTITFTFKSRSGTKSYTPRVSVEAIGQSINDTYA